MLLRFVADDNLIINEAILDNVTTLRITFSGDSAQIQLDLHQISLELAKHIAGLIPNSVQVYIYDLNGNFITRMVSNYIQTYMHFIPVNSKDGDNNNVTITKVNLQLVYTLPKSLMYTHLTEESNRN